MSDVTRLLSQIESGDPSSAETLLPLVYDELRKLAAARLSNEKPGQTIQATVLVHEAWLRLVGSDVDPSTTKLAVRAGAAIAASLVIGIAVSTWQAVRANHEAKRAEVAAKLAQSQEQLAVSTLDELRATAPAFAEQARTLAAKEQFREAIEKLDYAVKLRPDAAEYLLAKGDLLQCQLKLAEAASIYREALSVQPALARAEASATLCDELLAAKPNDVGKLTRESLAKLHLAMQRQQRPAAELMPVARLLGEEK